MARLTKDDWLAVGRSLLVQRGADALTVDELTARAGVTKGSFYHHFRGHPEFVRALLDDLRRRAFADVVSAVDTAAPPRAQLRQLAAAVAGHEPTLERAVRRWAASDDDVAAMVAAVDADRLAYVEALFQQATGDPEAARALTRLNYAFYVGCLHLDPPVHGEEYLHLAEQLERLLPSQREDPA
ncbi:TetR/AcrR family transcriptional regulator [Thalassiella azotivora]